MSADTVWRIAIRFLRPGGSHEPHFESMSNEDLDRWLEEHDLR